MWQNFPYFSTENDWKKTRYRFWKFSVTKKNMRVDSLVRDFHMKGKMFERIDQRQTAGDKLELNEDKISKSGWCGSSFIRISFWTSFGLW